MACVEGSKEGEYECPKNEKIQRKDGIGEEEKSLYVDAAEKHGNSWRDIFTYILQNGKAILPKAVYRKYEEAKEDNRKMKSIRSRIGNIRRKMKDSPRITSREKVHVIDTSSCKTVQDIAVRMQHAAKEEALDPVNDAPAANAEDVELCDFSDEEDNAGTNSEVTSNSSAEKTKEDTKKRIKPMKKSDKLTKLMEEASAMMGIAAKAAKTHQRYIKVIAANKSIDISSISDSD